MGLYKVALRVLTVIGFNFVQNIINCQESGL